MRLSLRGRVTSAWRRAWHIARTEGLLVLWYRILGETVYRRLLVLNADLPMDGGAPPQSCPMRWMDASEFARMAGFGSGVEAAEAERRIRSGHRCAIFETQGEWVHALWVSTRDAHMDYLGYALELNPGEAYVYQSYTPPRHRGRGYASAALVTVAGVLAAEGARRLVFCVQPDRSIAYPPILNAGAKPVGYVGWVGVGALRKRVRWRTQCFPTHVARALRARGVRRESDHIASA